VRRVVRDDGILAIGVAGGIGGLAQALPLGTATTCCCTPWSLLAALAAVIFVVKRTRTALEPAEGALIGLGVGAITGLLGGCLAALRQMASMDGLLGGFLRDRHEALGFGLAQHLWGAIVIFLVHALFGLVLGPLGGWIASLLVKPPPPPPTPPG